MPAILDHDVSSGSQNTDNPTDIPEKAFVNLMQTSSQGILIRHQNITLSCLLFLQ